MTVDQQIDIERTVAEVIRRLSFIQYFIMQQSGDFGTAGRERVIAGFCRHLLHIPPDVMLQSSHYTDFYKHVEEEGSEWSGKSIDELKRIEEETGFLLKEQFFRKHQDPAINALLQESGSAHRLFIGQLEEKYKIIIFGLAQEKKIGDFKILVIENEEARTPAAILPMVAAHGKEKQILLRREAFRVIFTEKWSTGGGDVEFAYSPEVEVRDRIKDVTLKSYQKGKKLKADQLEKIMVDEMLETTAVHETCHGAFSEAYADKSLLALGKILYVMPYAFIVQALDEILAEWKPKVGAYQGAMTYIANLGAHGEQPRAERLFWRYISDSWFLGNWDQAYLSDLTELFIASLMPFIKNKRQIDFSALVKEIPDTYNFFLHWWEKILKGCQHIIQAAQFEFRGFNLDFETLSLAQEKEFAKQGSSLTPDTEMYQRYFWTNMLRYLEKTAPTDFAKLKKYLADAREEIKKDLLAKLTDRADPGVALREWLLAEAQRRLVPSQKD